MDLLVRVVEFLVHPIHLSDQLSCVVHHLLASFVGVVHFLAVLPEGNFVHLEVAKHRGRRNLVILLLLAEIRADFGGELFQLPEILFFEEVLYLSGVREPKLTNSFLCLCFSFFSRFFSWFAFFFSFLERAGAAGAFFSP